MAAKNLVAILLKKYIILQTINIIDIRKRLCQVQKKESKIT